MATTYHENRLYRARITKEAVKQYIGSHIQEMTAEELLCMVDEIKEQQGYEEYYTDRIEEQKPKIQTEGETYVCQEQKQ